MKRFLVVSALLIFAMIVVSGCSSLTSIEQTGGGRYVITGWQTPGPVGFVWLCTYDPATRTMTLLERLPE